MNLDFKDFEKMPAEKRSKELQTLIETLKKEIEQTKKDLEQKEKNLKDAQEFLAKTESESKVLENVRTQQKTTNEEKNEKTEGRLAAKKQIRSLEEELEDAPQMKNSGDKSYFANKTLADIDKITSYISERQQKTGIETENDRKLMYDASKELDYRRNKIEDGSYNADRETRKHLEHAQENLKKEDKKQYHKHAF